MNPALFASQLQITSIYSFSGYSLAPDTPMPLRTVKDYEIEYFTRGGGGILIGRNVVSFPAHTINLRKPGQKVQGILPYDCLSLHLAPSRVLDELLSSLPDRLFPQNPAQIQTWFHNLMICLHMHDNASRLKATSNLYLILNELTLAAPEPLESPFYSNPHVAKAIRLIYQNIDQPLQTIQLAEQLGISKSHFQKLFKDCTGMTPKQFILSLKIERSKQLLQLTNETIGTIAAGVGFLDQVYFSYVFKHLTGMTPSKYRFQYRNK